MYSATAAVSEIYDMFTGMFSNHVILLLNCDGPFGEAFKVGISDVPLKHPWHKAEDLME